MDIGEGILVRQEQVRHEFVERVNLDKGGLGFLRLLELER